MDIEKKKRMLQLLKKKNQKNKKKNFGKKKGKDSEIDSRFARVKYDATFQKYKSKGKGHTTDSRFQSKLGKSLKRPKVDRYGNKIQTQAETAPKATKDQQQNRQKNPKNAKNRKKLKKAKKSENDESEASDSEDGDIKDTNGPNDAPLPFEWDASSSASSDFSGDIHELLGEANEEYDFLSDNEQVELKEMTSKRLAMMNYDWSRIKPGDIFIAMSSFIPAGGSVEKVSLYKSDFGIERMKLEQEQGPMPEVQGSSLSKKAAKVTGDTLDQPEGAVNEGWQIRQYELERLKYYYSVIEFDSGKTADVVYSNLNSYEIQSTGIKIDLRAVPDDLVFPREPEEVCTEMPGKASNLDFLFKARKHTNVELTWEKAEKGNKNAFLFELENEEDQDRVDLTGIIASDDLEDDSDEEGGEEAKEARRDPKEVRARLLGSASNKGVFADFDKGARRGGGQGIDVGFRIAFDEDDSESSEDEDDKRKIVFSRKFRDDRVKEREEGDGEDGDEAGEAPNKRNEGAGADIGEDDFFGDGLQNDDLEVPEERDQGGEDPEDFDEGPGRRFEGRNRKEFKKMKFRQKLKERRKKKALEEKKRREGVNQRRKRQNARADLELLSKRPAAAGKKEKKEFEVNMDDERFGRFFKDRNMAVDPTSTLYDKTKSKGLMEARRRRKKLKT